MHQQKQENNIRSCYMYTVQKIRLSYLKYLGAHQQIACPQIQFALPTAYNMSNCDDVMMSHLLSHVHTLYVRVYYLTCAVLCSGISEEAGCTALTLIPDGVVDAEETHPRGHVT